MTFCREINWSCCGVRFPTPVISEQTHTCKCGKQYEVVELDEGWDLELFVWAEKEDGN